MIKAVVIGGDERAERLTSLLEKEGNRVYTLGLRPGEEACPIDEADILLFPYPFSAPKGLVPNPRGLSINPLQILAQAKAGTYVLMGDDLYQELSAVEWMQKGLCLSAYGQDETFLEANAQISAEGAICYAMKQVPYTIAGSRDLVVGYGRFGRALARKLHALGGLVTVAARSERARQQARDDGMEAIPLEDLPATARQTQIFLNTVAARVIMEEGLKAFSRDALLLELASAPYGFDREAAQALGLAVVLLPGIPARYAPQSAAQALYDAIVHLTGGETP